MKIKPQMRKYIKIAVLSTLAIALTNSYLLAQNQKIWQWLRPSGGILYEWSENIGCNSYNNVFVCGTFMDTFHCGPQEITSAGGDDAYVAQYTEDGSVVNLWKGGGRRSDQANCMAVSNNNEVLIGGNMIDTVSFGNLHYSARGPRLYIAKLSSQGDVSWISSLIPTNASLFLLGVDTEGKIYASGVFSGNLASGNFSLDSHGGNDIFLARLSSSGVIEDLVAFGGVGDDIPSALTITPSGKIILAGSSTQPGSFQGFTLDPLPSSYHAGAFIAALDGNFNFKWKTQVLSGEYVNISSLKADQQDNVYAGGSFGFNIAIGESVISTQGYTDGFLIKYDLSGKNLWARGFGSWYYDYVNGLAIDKKGRIIAIGSLSDTLKIDNLILPAPHINSSLAIQFSPDGKATWGDCISGNGRNSNNDAVFDQAGNLYIVGSFSNTIEKDTAVFASNGDYDIYLAKYYSCPTDRAEILGKNRICPGSSIELSIQEGYNRIAWNDTLFNTEIINIDKPGQYRVSMLDSHQCFLADTVEVGWEVLTGFSLGTDLSVPVDSAVLLNAPEDFSDLIWQDNSHNNTFLATADNLEPGTRQFWLTALDPKGCIESDTIQISFYSLSGLDNQTENRIIIYPNPVKDFLTCSFTASVPANSSIEITDLYGRNVVSQSIEHDHSASTLKIDLSHINPGVYYLRLKNKEANLTESICVVKEK